MSADALVVTAPEVTPHADRLDWRVTVTLGATTDHIGFRLPPGPVDASLDPMLALVLPIAMRRNVPLRLEGGVSADLLEQADTIQDILVAWYPECRKIDVHPEQVLPPPAPVATPAPAAAASFFSGGLDSWYTAVRRRDALQSLVLVHGFDMALSKTDFRQRVVATLKPAVARLGLPLLEVETDLRLFTDRHVDWIHHFGAAMAATALLLRPRFPVMRIPASETYAHLDPCGSHPLLDPLWGGGGLALIFDGGEATRVEKVRFLRTFPTAFETLRVCWQNPEDAYNCGRCEKCLRTMVALEIAGLLSVARGFPQQLDLVALSWMDLGNSLVAAHTADNLREARAAGVSPALIAALQHSLDRFQRRDLRERLESFAQASPWVSTGGDSARERWRTRIRAASRHWGARLLRAGLRD